MLNDSPPVRYESLEELQGAVERASKRSLAPEEWQDVAPDWDAPYDDSDVAEVVQRLQETALQRPHPSAEEEGRRYRLAPVQRRAVGSHLLLPITC